MSGVSPSGLIFNRIQAAALDGQSVLALASGIDVLRVVSAGNTPQLTGISGGSGERAVILSNVSGVSFDIVHGSSAAAVADRFLIGSVNLVALNGTWVMVWYDPFYLCWRVLGR